MQVLIRETSQTSGPATVHDREFDGSELSFGSSPECAIQIIGRGVARRHGTLKPSGNAMKVACTGRARVKVDGTEVNTAILEPGSEFELAGTRVAVQTPPAGFDAAVAVTPARNTTPADLEGAYVTNLNQTWLSQRRPAWLLAAMVLLTGLAMPWLAPGEWVPWWASDAVWSSGPLHPAHGVAIGADCGACHVKAFQRVQDQQCLACHRNMTDHAPAPLAAHTGLDTIRCASCHKEHNEPMHLTISADALCTDCHAEPDWPDNRLAGVSGFTLTTHPAFSADLLVSSAEARGTGFVYEWQRKAVPLPEAADRSNLKFPHDVHLDPAMVQQMNTGEPLACADCHTLKADDEHFEPIRMEQHCRDCHDLKFDPRAPDRELPHGNPTEVLLTMEGHYMRLFGDPDAGQPDRQRRRLPGRASDTDTCDKPAYVCARERTAREAETQFTRRGCITCHEVAVHETDDLLGRYQVVPVRLTPDFFTVARFDHRAHLTQRDASGDAACLQCHEAKTSSASSDVLIPDIEQCVTCHGDHRQRNVVPLHCMDCHAFHPHGTGEGAE